MARHFNPDVVGDAFIDFDGFVRLPSGDRIDSDHPAVAEGVIYDRTGGARSETMIWADGSIGPGARSFNIWWPKNIPERPVQPPSTTRDWTEAEMQVLRAVEGMINTAISRERQLDAPQSIEDRTA